MQEVDFFWRIITPLDHLVVLLIEDFDKEVCPPTSKRIHSPTGFKEDTHPPHWKGVVKSKAFSGFW